MSKMIPDYHLHSSFSDDCESDIFDIIDAAREIGLDSICITDHNDLDFPDTPEGLSFNLDIDNYIPTLMNIRASLPDFDLRIGIEQGVMPSTASRLEGYSSLHPGIDFIICSTHVVDGYDPYYASFWDGREPEDCYRKYFEDTLYNVTHFKDYSVYGHLDYILRYGPGSKKASEIDLKPYIDIIEEILKNIISSGKGIEINTGSLYRGMDFSHPHIEILKLYKVLGGEILTFGSDSHDITHVGYGLEAARQLANSLGFRWYSEFRELNATFVEL